eukprot:780783-Pelagomonas_calceolata.AAC.1
MQHANDQKQFTASMLPQANSCLHVAHQKGSMQCAQQRAGCNRAPKGMKDIRHSAFYGGLGTSRCFCREVHFIPCARSKAACGSPVKKNSGICKEAHQISKQEWKKSKCVDSCPSWHELESSPRRVLEGESSSAPLKSSFGRPVVIDWTASRLCTGPCHPLLGNDHCKPLAASADHV